MHDQEVDDASLATTAESDQAPSLSSPALAPRYTSLELDEIEARLKNAFVTKHHPVPVVYDESLWLVSGYYRAAHALKFVAWCLTDKGGTDHQISIEQYGRTWWVTGYSTIMTFGSDEAYEQLTMEDLNDVK